MVYYVPYDKNITWKKGKGKQFHLPYNNKAFGKNINWGRGRKFWGRKIKIFENGGGEKYEAVGN